MRLKRSALYWELDLRRDVVHELLRYVPTIVHEYAEVCAFIEMEKSIAQRENDLRLSRLAGVFQNNGSLWLKALQCIPQRRRQMTFDVLKRIDDKHILLDVLQHGENMNRALEEDREEERNVPVKIGEVAFFQYEAASTRGYGDATFEAHRLIRVVLICDIYLPVSLSQGALERLDIDIHWLTMGAPEM